jgi:hypothetical protein
MNLLAESAEFWQCSLPGEQAEYEWLKLYRLCVRPSCLDVRLRSRDESAIIARTLPRTLNNWL